MNNIVISSIIFIASATGIPAFHIPGYACPQEDLKNNCSGPKDCLYPNPANCSSFIQCTVSGLAYIMPCFNGLEWHNENKTCVFPEDSTCDSSPVTTESEIKEETLITTTVSTNITTLTTTATNDTTNASSTTTFETNTTTKPKPTPQLVTDTTPKPTMTTTITSKPTPQLVTDTTSKPTTTTTITTKPTSQLVTDTTPKSTTTTTITPKPTSQLVTDTTPKPTTTTTITPKPTPQLITRAEVFTCSEADIEATGCKGLKNCLYPNPENCDTFIQCVPQPDGSTKPFVIKSFSRLLWNKKVKICDCPQSSTCSEESTDAPTDNSTKRLSVYFISRVRN